MLGHPAAAIRAARLHARLTQQQAADRAGMAQPHWARLEAGTREPSMAMLRRVADALGCAVEVLFVQR